jgi:hypothetical protein
MDHITEHKRDSENQRMDNKIIGGFACGAIRYESNESPKFSLICQCRQCQHIPGSGHAAQFAVAEESTQIQGKVKYYDQASDSRNTVNSRFCSHCGSPVFKKSTGGPGLLFFHAGTLDDPSIYKPKMVL